MRAALVALVALAAAGTAAHPPAVEAPAGDAIDGAVTDFEPVRVTAPRPAGDPFAFRNPVQVRDTVFERSWREPMSAEEIGMQGGIVALAIAWTLDKSAQGISRLPGWKHQVQAATARPPPLQGGDLQRALRYAEPAADAGAQPTSKPDTPDAGGDTR